MVWWFVGTAAITPKISVEAAIAAAREVVTALRANQYDMRVLIRPCNWRPVEAPDFQGIEFDLEINGNSTRERLSCSAAIKHLGFPECESPFDLGYNFDDQYKIRILKKTHQLISEKGLEDEGAIRTHVRLHYT